MPSSWKRSLELAYTNHYIITKVNEQKPVNWLLLDVGLENVTEEHINQSLDNLLIGFNRLFKYKSVKQATLGYFRMLDIVKQNDRYHPKIHVLLPTMKSYFQGRYYIKRDKWLEMWAKALGVNTDLYVKVKVIQPEDNSQQMVEKMEQGLAVLLDVQETNRPKKDKKIIETRRLIGYSRLLKKEADQLPPDSDFFLDIAHLCTDDRIANVAFANMLTWHPGLRTEKENPFI
ncbi:protein rep [Virgibacillus sp. Bac330]|uniref:protein rep n=1 Tax=Virgibacillus sp. Bac330 TaxID=2419841 RepID=UPI000EF45C2C|nr:protein rep [Virgibacillus sp. Bac330]